MKNITLYLDMDGVLCNFEKAYRAMWNEFVYDRERFKEAVLVRKIFSTLEYMPNAEKLLDGVRKIESKYDITIEMLTSTGSHRTEMKAAAIEQKTKWLLDHDIKWHPNFVSAKPEKAQYAKSTTLLLDDMAGCIDPFKTAGGYGILHADSQYDVSLTSIERILSEIK
jgi:beta-phosphoglucomutase-like phosphatase (HAD superfamily)